MKTLRWATRLIIVALLIGLVSMFPGRGLAAYPEKGLTLIVAYGAGGGTDTTARLLAADLSEVLGQSVTVRNVTGGGGWNGWGTIAGSRPDGYTIGYINIPNMFAGYLDKRIGRPESLNSFTTITNHVTDPCIWAVKADSPFKSVNDLITYAKANPGELSITAHGNGSDDHVAILSMQEITGTGFKIIHNTSTAISKTQVLGGHVDVLGGNVSEVVALAKKGELRVLGVMSEQRSEFLPQVSTFREQGFDSVWAVSRGIAAPAGLPADIRNKITTSLEKVLSSEEHRAKAATLGLKIQIITGDAYATFLKNMEQNVKKLMGW